MHGEKNIKKLVIMVLFLSVLQVSASQLPAASMQPVSTICMHLRPSRRRDDYSVRGYDTVWSGRNLPKLHRKIAGNIVSSVCTFSALITSVQADSKYFPECKKVKQSRYRPRVAQRFPGS